MDIALQLEKTTGVSVAVNENVLFNNVEFTAGNITYVPATGVITFNEAGRYSIEWFVAVQSSPSTNGAVFALSTSAGDFIEGNNPMKTGEVVGLGIIEVEEAPVTLSLVNASTAIVYYNNQVPVKAGLKLIQDDLVADIGGGAVIPFASGLNPMLMTSIAGGLVGTPSFVAFGASESGPNLTSPINLQGASSMAFSLSRDGTITSISAYFNNLAEIDLTDSTVSITVQLYQSTTPNEIFTAIPGTSFTLSPALSGIVPVGFSASGSLTGLSIPVTANTRLLLVYSITATGESLVNTVVGTASAGVTIQ